MNTERPDNDDAEARSAAGSTGGTGGASGNDGAADAADRRDGSTAAPGPGTDQPADGTGPAPAAEAGASGAEQGSGPDESAAAADDAGTDTAEAGAEAEEGTPEHGPQPAPDTTTPAGGAGATAPRPEPEAAADETVVGTTGDGARRPGDDGAAGGPARRRSPLLIASVAAAVLLVGGGGAYLATGAAGDSGSGSTPGANGDTTPPPLALDGAPEGPENGIAPGEPDPYGAAYRADGSLPSGPGSAPVYRAHGEVTEQQVVTLAKALELEGKPVAEGGAWRIGGQDGTGPTLRVDRAAPGSWTFSRNTPGTDNCKGATCRVPSAGDGKVVSEAAAAKAAAPVLKAVGQDDAKLDASHIMGDRRVVNADPEVGGLPTYGWTTGVVVGATGEVVGGNGRLTEPVKGDTYPTVSAQEALDLMNAAAGDSPRAGIGGCATSVPLEEDRQQEDCAPGTKPAGETVTVDDAEFGLASHSVDGRPALVPAWLFEVRPEGAREASTVTYPAVDPEFLAPAARSGEASGSPTPPGDEPTATVPAGEAEVEGYTAEGAELTVVFTGGVCADYEVTASEGDGRVTVRVTETPWPDKVCILIAKQYQETVRLDAPLGDREVVGTDGEPVPLHKAGARLPAPPSR
ncbi:hypothetical protein HTV45_08625 [Streptomyces sp. CHD11]|uniref:hypothetical protein n=1 Tax=Streptomyces sp. CHD11 TaxID=2741325 RepID=UPI001BFC83E7|nr:hypothetical protein [Streptomyces sp. CHD11]MBT3150951.1 hypothetical protein [Streptomyces sp. CHD11]